MKNVNVEEIFKTITDLEGPKYPLDNMDELNEAGDYILDKLRSYGIKTEVQEFYVKGMKEPFRNIIGKIGDQTKPAIVLGSHYDTVRNCPGANDNFSSVAVSLEAARILSQMDNPPTVIIAAFSLEEAHPGFVKALETSFVDAGIYDSKNRFTSARLLKLRVRFWNLVSTKRKGLKTDLPLIFEEILKEIRDTLQEDEIRFIEICIKIYKDFREENSSGKLLYSLGSQEFVRRAIKEKTSISNIINFDCLGWITNRKNTQKKLPFGKEVESILKLHKTKLEDNIGNFIGVMGEKNSQSILNEFLKQCESEEVDMPFFGICLPLEYKEIVQAMPDMLRSDHAPFWQAGIPGIFISDTANFRSDFYHTPADTYQRLDYDSLGKITVATINTIHAYRRNFE